MKITLIGPVYPYRGGIAHFTIVLAQKLGEAGHDVQMISFKKQYPTWLYPGKSDKDFSEGRDKVDAKYLLTPMNPLSWQRTIKTIIDFRPEKVIIPWWITFWGPAFHYLISHVKRKGISTTILIHNTLPHEANLIDKQIARWTLKTATHFIVMTPKERERLLTLLPGITSVNISPHPIYCHFKSSQMDKQELRLKLGLPIDQPIMLFFGFVRPYKGLHDLLKAQKLILAEGIKITLVVAGEFWDDLNSYEQHIKILGLSNYVKIFNKYIPDEEVAQYFELADLFVDPYCGGTQSGILKTALGFGIPSVVTDVIVDDLIKYLPQQCKVVPSKDPQSLAKGILEQLNVPTLSHDKIESIYSQTWDKLINTICHTKCK
jgi:glycosyltransferase involved in cell wall biosynthesis